MIAGRKALSEVVVEALVSSGEMPAIDALLANREARLGHASLEALVAISREAPHLAPALLRRPELRPAQAYVLFWWADPERSAEHTSELQSRRNLVCRLLLEKKKHD